MQKIRRRYLAVKIDSEETFYAGEFVNAVWGAITKLYGEYGASRTGLALIDYDDERQLVILRTVHTAVDVVRAALASIARIGDKPVALHVLKVSGTIRALHKKIMQ